MTAKTFYTQFSLEILPLMQIAVPKGRDVSGSFYKNVVLKKLQPKLRKIHPKNQSPACPFVT